jgi:hypothetical protein
MNLACGNKVWSSVLISFHDATSKLLQAVMLPFQRRGEESWCIQFAIFYIVVVLKTLWDYPCVYSLPEGHCSVERGPVVIVESTGDQCHRPGPCPSTRLYYVHCKKRLSIFPSPDGMSLTKLSLAGREKSTSFFNSGNITYMILALQSTYAYSLLFIFLFNLTLSFPLKAEYDLSDFNFFTFIKVNYAWFLHNQSCIF